MVTQQLNCLLPQCTYSTYKAWRTLSVLTQLPYCKCPLPLLLLLLVVSREKSGGHKDLGCSGSLSVRGVEDQQGLFVSNDLHMGAVYLWTAVFACMSASIHFSVARSNPVPLLVLSDANLCCSHRDSSVVGENGRGRVWASWMMARRWW